ncbi:hypothetical protein Nepgr_013870 [Nepenthes gracilis]|uniref:Uncharacterized protein n=1 Tax=Nepenthes gracilis TaxID=150966 RepID=A0AAD3XPL2_NEPGR|nr:hypothetical protein Nepgr_013870 [Nepenthes gracilis]
MPPAAASPPPPASPSSAQTIDLISQILCVLHISCLSAKSFVGRFQVLHSRLTALEASLSEITDAPHWSDNSLLQALLPNLLSTLQRLLSLADQCHGTSFTGGKLLMQSDLDRISISLSDHLHDIDLLLRSGVLRQSSAIVLSHPVPGSAKEDLIYYIRDLFTRLQIGGLEFKEKALESLIRLLSDDEKSALLVAREGNIPSLIQLLDNTKHPLIREQAISVVAILASANDQSRKAVFDEGGLGPLLRILETGTLGMKEKAAMGIEALTADPENAWAVAAYGGVPILIEACKCGSMLMQVYSVGAIKNISIVEDIRSTLVDESALTVLMQLLVSGNNAAQERAANCLSILASSSNYFRALIIQERGFPRLLKLFHDSTSFETLEHVLTAILALSSSDPIARMLSSSTNFITQLSELIIHGNVILQKISATLISNLSFSDGNKRAIASCMPHLVRLMELPKPGGIQEVASQALVSLLTVRSNRKELARDEKSLMRLTHMLDVQNEAVCKQYPVAVVSALAGGGSNGCRKRLVAVGALTMVQRLAEMEVAGAKKAVLRLSGNRLKNILSRTWRE